MNLRKYIREVLKESFDNKSIGGVKVYHRTKSNIEGPMRTPAFFSTDIDYGRSLGPNVITATLDIKNPADLKSMHISPSDPYFPEIAKELASKGYDGAYYGVAWIAFYPEQINIIEKTNTLKEFANENETMTVYRIGEIPYDEKSFFVAPDWKHWVKFYPNEPIYKIITNKLYLPLTNKSFNSFNELRRKADSGEFSENDLSYIYPEESGIQHFEQYEIKPEDIIGEPELIKKSKKDLGESVGVNEIIPPTIPNSMNFWHGGNLDSYDDIIAQKTGRYEYGPGLYATTSYEVVKRYAKGSRKLYLLTIEKGVDIEDVFLDLEKVTDFMNSYVIGSKRKPVMERLSKYIEDGKVPASIFNNLILNHQAIQSTKTKFLRSFLVTNGIDYEMVDNAFGFGEKMIVLYNMNKIINQIQIKPGDKIQVFDLPKNFN